MYEKHNVNKEILNLTTCKNGNRSCAIGTAIAVPFDFDFDFDFRLSIGNITFKTRLLASRLLFFV